jgi:GntR family transcriptional regulator
MWITCDPKSETPVSSQIVAALVLGIAEGRVKDGEKLPSVRAAAELWRVNPNTVLKVYQELEREGYVEAKNGSGVWIAAGAVKHAKRSATKRLEADLIEWARRAEALGVSKSEIRAMIASTLIDRQPEKTPS